MNLCVYLIKLEKEYYRTVIQIQHQLFIRKKINIFAPLHQLFINRRMQYVV